MSTTAPTAPTAAAGQSPQAAPAVLGQGPTPAPTGRFPAPARLLWRLAGGRATPDRLRLLFIGTVAASLLWGAAAAWTAAVRTSAAGRVVAVSEPLSYDAQQIYQSLSDADATEAAAFLAATEPASARNRYLADIARAASYLEAATAAGGSQGAGSQLAVLSVKLPIYAGLVETARADNAQGLPVGAAYLAEASYLMRATLLPAADALYEQQNARLSADYQQATGLPILAIVVALTGGCALVLAQLWLSRRTRRSFNRGLLVVSAAGLLSFGWLIASLTVARVQLSEARDHGSAPVEALAQANIAALRGNAYESLTLINRSGDDINQGYFRQVQKQLGPGPGTLLTEAAIAAKSSPGARDAAAAAAAAPSWFATHQKVRALDDGGSYEDAVHLAIGSGPTSSDGRFRRVDAGLTSAISADQAEFGSAASAGQGALAGLDAGMIVAGLVMAAGCAWGLIPRIAEYR